MDLRRRWSAVSIKWRLRLWWNWQTRYFEVVVGQPVQVQVLLSAPIFFGESCEGGESRTVFD